MPRCINANYGRPHRRRDASSRAHRRRLLISPFVPSSFAHNGGKFEKRCRRQCAAKDSYFPMHIAPTRRKKRARGRRSSRGRQRRGKERSGWRNRRTRAEIKAKSGGGEEKKGWRKKEEMREEKKWKLDVARKSLRLVKLRNMETQEPISRNHAADIGEGGGGGVVGREAAAGYMQIFFQHPHGKPRPPFCLSRFSRAYLLPPIYRIYSFPPLLLLPTPLFASLFLLSIALFTPLFFLSPLPAFSRRVCKKCKKWRRESVVVSFYIYRASPYSRIFLSRFRVRALEGSPMVFIAVLSAMHCVSWIHGECEQCMHCNILGVYFSYLRDKRVA